MLSLVPRGRAGVGQSIHDCPLAVFLAYPVLLLWLCGFGVLRFGESARTQLVASLVTRGPPGTHL